MNDIRQNKNYANYLKRQNWIVEEKDGVYYYIKKFLFISAIKVQRPKKIDLKYLNLLLKKYRAFQVSIEPKTFAEADKLIEKGWKVNSPFIPSKTVILDLRKSEKNIYESFNKDTRYSIRKSERVNIYEEDDLEKFRNYWKRSVNIKRYVLKTKQMNDLKETFGKDSLFLIAGNGSSGGIFLVAGDVGYYWYGFVNEEGRKSLSQYKVLWEGIKWAKTRKAKYFDMEGIFDDRFPITAWLGFTKFKKGFGGSIEKFPGSYQKIILPF